MIKMKNSRKHYYINRIYHRRSTAIPRQNFVKRNVSLEELSKILSNNIENTLIDTQILQVFLLARVDYYYFRNCVLDTRLY